MSDEDDLEPVDADDLGDPEVLAVELPDADDDDDEDVLAVEGEEAAEGDEASLEELLAERTAARRGSEEAEDEDELLALVPEPDVLVDEVLPLRVVPVRDTEEFVCARCHLVKKKVQLVDEDRQLCRDCA